MLFKSFPFFRQKCCFLKVCIVGSGPSGFSVARYLLKNHDSLTVDMLEKEFPPYGLIRYGVAPDHQLIKNTIHNFSTVTSDNRFKYFGGIHVGSQITIKELSEYFDCIVLCYGRFIPNKLKIPGENLPNIFSSTEFVSWYNDHPRFQHIRPDLDGSEAVVIGNGNVALDVSRILTIDPAKISNTDISSKALKSLSNGKKRNVKLFGRRGLDDVSFTAGEIRALSKLDIDLLLHEDTIFNGKSPRRVVELMKKVCKWEKSEKPSITFYFNRPALSIESSINSRMLINFHNKINGDIEKIECDLLVHCIGYSGENIDNDIPFDEKMGIIKNMEGRIFHDNNKISSLYCAGWIKTGSKGIIADTINSANETASNIIQDLKDGNITVKKNKDLIDILDSKGVKYIDFEKWKEIDRLEIELGQKLGKLREKILDFNKYT